MKKNWIATATLGALATWTGGACAQSSVTLFGVLDVAVRAVKNGDGSTVYTLTNDGVATSRLGFRGSEDLGSGYSAAFWLEGAIGPDVGASGTVVTVGTGSSGASQNAKFWSRKATVSLLSPAGEIRLGRDYVPTFWNLSLFHAYGGVGVGNILNVMGASGALNTTGTLGSNAGTLVRADNSVAYHLPRDIGGVYGQVNVAAGEGTNTSNGNNRYVGARIGWARDAFDIAGAYARTQVPGSDDFRLWNIGVSYRLPVARVMAVYHRAEFRPAGLASRNQQLWAVSAVAPIGSGDLRMAYQRSKIHGAANSPVGLRQGDDSSEAVVGYIYNISKRTALYTDLGRIWNKGLSALTIPGGTTTGSNLGTLPNRDSTALAVGIKHVF